MPKPSHLRSIDPTSAPASLDAAGRPSGVAVEVELKPGRRRFFTAAEKLRIVRAAAACTEHVEVRHVVTSHLQVVEHAAATQNIVGDVQHVVRVLVGPGSEQDSELRVDAPRQVDRTHELVNRRKATAGHSLHAFCNFLGRARPMELRLPVLSRLRSSLELRQALADLLLLLIQLLT